MKCTPGLYLFLTLLLRIPTGSAQKAPCSMLGYDYPLAVRAVQGYLLKGDNFEYFSDDPTYREVFSTKAVLRKRSRLAIVPVVKVAHRDRLNDSLYTGPLLALFSPTYWQFMAFLLDQQTPTALLVSSPEPYKRGRVPANFGRPWDGELRALFDAFQAPGICLFYDMGLGRLAYVKNDSYVFWNEELKRFSEVQGAAGYRNLYYSYNSR